MNDNFNDQKEKLVSISHEINLLRQQVNYLLRNEKALSLLDLDVLMNRTHAIYDLICSVSLGNEADEQDLELDPEAIAGLFGIGEEPEPDESEELMEEPEEEPVEEPEEELVLESEEELVEEPEEEMFEEPVEEPVVEPKEEMFEEPEIPEVSEPNSSEVLEPAPEFDTVFKPVFEPEPIIDEPVEEEQVAPIEMELEPEPVEEEQVAPIEMEFEPEPVEEEQVAPIEMELEPELVEEEQVAPIEMELEPELVEEEQDAPIELELEPEFDREPEAAESSISENLEPEDMFVYDPQEDATAPETVSEPEVFVEHVEEAPELEPEPAEPAVSQSWSTEVFESEPEPDRPVVIDGKTVHFVEEVPENEIPERDRVGGEELPKNNLFGLSLFDDEDFEMAPTETLGEKWGHEDNSLASKLQQNPGSDLKASIGINDKFLFVNELFGGSMEKYNKSIDNLNDLKTLNGAMIYLNELKIELQWNSSNEAYQRLSDLVSRKFE